MSISGFLSKGAKQAAIPPPGTSVPEDDEMSKKVPWPVFKSNVFLPADTVSGALSEKYISGNPSLFMSAKLRPHIPGM
jgi:hypothetical protein